MSDLSGDDCDSGPRNPPKKLRHKEERENVATNSSVLDSSVMLNTNKGEDFSSKQSGEVAIYEFFETGDERLAEILLCSKCRFIVVPSVDSYFCEAGHYLCTLCGKQSGLHCPVMEAHGIKCFLDGERSKLSFGGFPLHEAVFKAVDFKCKYATAGCQEIINSDTMDEHQNDCNFRPTEGCLFSNCAKFYFLELLNHYETIHRVKTFMGNHMSIAVLYDRPEAAEPLTKRLRWVSFIFCCLPNHLLITVERCKGDWMIWAYALNDQENLDSYKFSMHLQDTQAGKKKLVGLLNIHSRSVSSEEIINTNKCLKLTADEMEPNLYSSNDSNSKGTSPRYLLFYFTILMEFRPAENIIPEKSSMQFPQKRAGEYENVIFHDGDKSVPADYHRISEAVPELKGRIQIPAGYGNPNSLNTVSEGKVPKVTEECMAQTEDTSQAEVKVKPTEEDTSEEEGESSEESVKSIVEIYSPQKAESHEALKPQEEAKSQKVTISDESELNFQEGNKPYKESKTQEEEKLQGGEMFQSEESHLGEAASQVQAESSDEATSLDEVSQAEVKPREEAKSYEEEKLYEGNNLKISESPLEEAKSHEEINFQIVNPQEEVKAHVEVNSNENVKPCEEPISDEESLLQEVTIFQSKEISQAEKKVKEGEKLQIEESPLKERKPHEEVKSQEETMPEEKVNLQEETKYNEKAMSREEETPQSEESLLHETNPQEENNCITKIDTNPTDDNKLTKPSTYQQELNTITFGNNQARNVSVNTDTKKNQEVSNIEPLQKESDMKIRCPSPDDLSVSSKINNDLNIEMAETLNEIERKKAAVATLRSDDESDDSSGDDEFEDARSDISNPTTPPKCNVA